MGIIASDMRRIIIGLGATGVSVARHLARKGVPFAVVDTRENPAGIEDFQAEFPATDVHCGELDAALLATASELIVSPGVAISHPAIQAAMKQGVHVCGDIDLFCREVSAPIVAITGSNAKSTVTTLVGQMAAEAGIDVGVGGNLGLPVLDMLAQGEQELYVLELSSFQLETCHELRAAVATVLNISPDHQDRYPDMQAYYLAKHRIFRGCQHAVVNRDDPLSSPLLPKGVAETGFHLGNPDLGLYGLVESERDTWLALGQEKLLSASEMRVRGQHNLSNMLAALALGQAVNLPMPAMLQALRSFTGLEHRCQWVAEKEGVAFFNDSKGTNVGATVAALNGLGTTQAPDQKIILIAGGEGKGAAFDDLAKPVAQYCRATVLIGNDAPAIEKVLDGQRVAHAASMDDAVAQAAKISQPGDIVLLSPACASFDMFANFNVRGQVFVAAVEAL